MPQDNIPGRVREASERDNVVNPDPVNLDDALKSFSETLSEIKAQFDPLLEAAGAKSGSNPISENVSQNKVGRGRPPKYTQKDYEPFAELRANTPRGKQNYLLAGCATSVLMSNQERFAYLLKPKYRTTILAELGRFGDPRVMVRVADEICSTRMKTAKAVGLCRRMRGKGRPDLVKLAEAITRTIKKYTERYQTVSPAEIITALRIVGLDYTNDGK